MHQRLRESPIIEELRRWPSFYHYRPHNSRHSLISKEHQEVQSADNKMAPDVFLAEKMAHHQDTIFLIFGHFFATA